MTRFETYPVLFMISVITIATGCSERRENPVFPEIHPDSWMEPDSPDFHGLRVLAEGIEFCFKCHGEDAGGGVRSVACFQCHEDSGGGCLSCHGGLDNDTSAPPRDLSGNTIPDSTGVGAHTIHLEGEGDFTGFYCGVCHVVPATLASIGHQDSPLPAEVIFDAGATTSEITASWDRPSRTCRGVVCHGAANTSPVWTEEHDFLCTDCHGDPTRDTGSEDFDTGPAPPRDLSGQSGTTVRGVGAHETHVTTGPLRVGIDCDECHEKPSSTADPGHIEGGPPFQAEISWGDLADNDRDQPTDPVYVAGDDPRCTDTYCHGGGFEEEGKGTLTEPTWTIVDGTQSACGACHNLPPHDPFGSCEFCHGSVVLPDTTISEGGKSLHINGNVDF